MNGHDCDYDTQDQIESDEKPIQSASGASEKSIQDTGEGNRDCIHSGSRADQNPLP
jgi:hypothetical protein